MNRRDFIKRSGLASTALLVPRFLQAASGLRADNPDGPILVMVQLSGGNDGLNTVVPYANDLYYQARPGLALGKDEVLILEKGMGLHPNMEGLHEIYQQGWLSILNHVGYPNPNRSHFRSMDIWHSGSPSDESWTSGWLGRWLDAHCQQGGTPSAAIEVNDTLSLAMRGENSKGLAIQNPNAVARQINALVERLPQAPEAPSDNLNYLYKTLAETQSGVGYLQEAYRLGKTQREYPNHAFGKHMKTIAQLILGKAHTRVYYAELGGFDTHIQQKNKQGRLLKQYSDAMLPFMEEMRAAKLLDRVVVVTFSEFGRRVAQNASGGTDHGTANNLFVMGGKLAHPGIANEAPDLSSLDEGDLKYRIDFRSVYADLLKHCLGSSAESVGIKGFEPLGLFS